MVANAGLPSGLAVRFGALPFFIYYTAAQYQTPEELERGFGASLTLLLLSGAFCSPHGGCTPAINAARTPVPCGRVSA
ncbi:hypothetical protein [Bilophila wadsworthia]|uniref:hypothetical protein n=1 Tax=Bilophila wadsworthia TaxID=35833 RepID=UPI00242D14FB|nr:hypothetical protein [Bilophila wadsworthia]